MTRSALAVPQDADFVRRFGALLLQRGTYPKSREDVTEYGWQDNKAWRATSWRQEVREWAAHLAKLEARVDWPRLRESDFDIGWWEKFNGTFTRNQTVQLIRVNFPLRDGGVLPWAAELELSEAIKAVCSGMTFRERGVWYG